MSVKAGKVITLGNGFLFERGQTTGASSVSIATERIKETGNTESVSVERDIPAVTWDIDSLDMTLDTEAVICGVDPTTLVAGDELHFENAVPLDVVAPWIHSGASYFSEAGVIWPFGVLSSAVWKFGVGTAGANQVFTFQGDSQYGGKKTPYREVFPARGGGRTFNVATTSGSAGIVGTGSAFSSADVGAPVTGTGIPASTTILSVTDATHATLSANATATGASVATTVTPSATYSFANAAVSTDEQNADLYAVGLTVYYADGTWQRLFYGEDYTNTSADFTLIAPGVAPPGSKVAACYFSAVPFEFAQIIHTDPVFKPGKVKGKDINLYVAVAPKRTFSTSTTSASTTVSASGGAFTATDVGARLITPNIPAGAVIVTVDSSTQVTIDHAATATGAGSTDLKPQLIRWEGVQTADINWKVTLNNDDELGNVHHVDTDYDIVDLTGTITLRPRSNNAFFDKYAQITGSDPDKVSNLISETALEMQIRLFNPKTGTFLKSFVIEDAEILPPAVQVRAGQKTDPQMTWSSQSGTLRMVKGLPVA